MTATSRAPILADRLPPQAFFLVSAVFHYLGPAFAVLLFAEVAPLGVAWIRIASAAAVFAAWRRPWRCYRRLDAGARRTVLALGIVLAGMDACFYLAIDRLPLGTVGAIEFIGPIGLAGIRDALPALFDPRLLAAGIAVGICSSVIPYVSDQLAMARLPRASFALLLSLLPATASVIGVIVLRQVPSAVEAIGIGLVIAGVALHRAAG